MPVTQVSNRLQTAVNTMMCNGPQFPVKSSYRGGCQTSLGGDPSPSASSSAGFPSTGAIESKQPRLRSKIAKELKFIEEFSVSERWLAIKYVKADCTKTNLKVRLEINSNTTHSKFYLSFISLFKDVFLRSTVVGFCEGDGRGVSL